MATSEQTKTRCRIPMQAPPGNRTCLPAGNKCSRAIPFIPQTSRCLPPDQKPAGRSPVHEMADQSPVYKMAGRSPDYFRLLFSSQEASTEYKLITVKQAVAMFTQTPRLWRAHPGFTLTWLSETARPKKHGTRLSSEHVARMGMTQINMQRKKQNLAPFKFATIVCV